MKVQKDKKQDKQQNCLNDTLLSENDLYSQNQNRIFQPSENLNQDKQNKFASTKSGSIKEKYQSSHLLLKGANFIQSFFFSWIGLFLSYGFRCQLTKDSAPYLPINMKPKIEFQTLSNQFNLLKKQQNYKDGRKLLKSIFMTYKKELFLVVLFGFFFAALSMYVTVITHQIIKYIQGSEESNQNREISTGVILFSVVFLITFLKIVSQSHVYYHFGILGYNLSTSLSLLLYNKSLKYPILSQKLFNSSQIINYSQVDAQRMKGVGFQLTSLIFIPIQVIVAIYLMYSFIGISFLSGLFVMISSMLFTYFLMKIQAKLNSNLSKAKDARMKVTEEILSAIRFIKVNSYEKYFFNKLNVKRNQELKLNKDTNLANIFIIFIFWLANPLILSATFATYIWLGNQMNASQAFTTIMLFKILQYPIKSLPKAISEIIKIWISLKRIEKYLLADEITSENVKFGNNKDLFAIRITNGTYQWGKYKSSSKDDKKQKQKQELPKVNQVQSQQKMQSENEDSQDQNYVTALKDINLSFQTGKFTMIVGDIGSGKSSILLAILNQMKAKTYKNPQKLQSQYCKKSLIQINGNLAYVPQKPWIMSATLKENILFTQIQDQQKFWQVVDMACLKEDLNILVNKQNTEIGEKGTNLSGGQKARVALARALYSDRDIYLFDDVISAVDVNVGDFLVKQMILNYLKRKGKTIIMPTHALKYAQHADQIIIMKKGRIIKKGAYQQIKNTEQFQQLSIILQIKQKKQKQKKQEDLIIQDLKKLAQYKSQKNISEKLQNNKQQQKKEMMTQKIVQELIQPQEKSKGSVSFQLYKEYIRLSGGWIFLLVICISMVFWLGLSTRANIEIQHWCQNPQIDSNIHLIVFITLSLGSSIFMLIRAYTLITGGIRLGATSHKKIIKALLYAPLINFYNRVPMGRIVNRLSKDLRQIDQQLGQSVGDFISVVFSLLGNLVICIYASSYFIILPMFLVGYLANKLRIYYMKTQRDCVRFQKITSSPIVSGFLSTINGLSTIRAYNLEQKFLNLQIQKVDLNKRFRITREVLQSWFCQRLSFITFMINMTAIAYCIFSDNQNASLAGLLLTYALTLGDDIIQTTFQFSSLQNQMVSIERISTFIKIQPEIGYKQYTKLWHTRQEGYTHVIENGEIQFKNCQIRYRQDLPLIIKNISFKIQAGEKIGIVGRTGSGKSTIINAILRILDCQQNQGQILIDGKNIKNQYFIKNLRHDITMIDQDPTLINATFKQNLDPRHIYSEQDLTNIVKQCNLYEIIMEKGGLQAQITNDSLSIGEKQLLCICRTFLKKSKIVLIDEATANIDQKNDQLIQQVIRKKFKNSTVLTIAHRLSTLKNSDKILVLQNGNILQFDSPQNLLKKQNSFYKTLLEKDKNQYLK